MEKKNICRGTQSVSWVFSIWCQTILFKVRICLKHEKLSLWEKCYDLGLMQLVRSSKLCVTKCKSMNVIAVMSKWVFFSPGCSKRKKNKQNSLIFKTTILENHCFWKSPTQSGERKYKSSSDAWHKLENLRSFKQNWAHLCFLIGLITWRQLWEIPSAAREHHNSL